MTSSSIHAQSLEEKEIYCIEVVNLTQTYFANDDSSNSHQPESVFYESWIFVITYFCYWIIFNGVKLY